MEQRKPWQFYLIITVVILTLINILPTVIYYTKPLREPVDQERAMQVASGIAGRVNDLEVQAVEWLHSFTKHLGAVPEEIKVLEDDPQIISLTFKNSADTAKFQRYLPDAGARIPFVPAQLGLSARRSDDPVHTVYVQRQIGVRLDPNNLAQYFTFTDKFNDAGQPTTKYRELVYSRVAELGVALGGESETAQSLAALKQKSYGVDARQVVSDMAAAIVESQKSLGDDPALLQRVCARLTRTNDASSTALVSDLVSKMEQTRVALQTERDALEKTQKDMTEAGGFLDTDSQRQLQSVTQRLSTLQDSTRVLKEHTDWFEPANRALTVREVLNRLQQSEKAATDTQLISLGDVNPYVASITIDWANDQVHLNLHTDVAAKLTGKPTSEQGARLQDYLRKQLFQTVAEAAQLTDEVIQPVGTTYTVRLDKLNGSRSLLALELSAVAQDEATRIGNIIRNQWKPQHPELQAKNFTVYDWKSFQALPPVERKLGLVVYAPAADSEMPPRGFSPKTIYVIARGLSAIFQKYDQGAADEQGDLLRQDFMSLRDLLAKQGMQDYTGYVEGVDPEYSRDAIFHKPAYSSLLAATREDFAVLGTNQRAVLEFTDVEQRINTLNKIENSMHEDLLKRRELYESAQVSLTEDERVVVPPPSRNVYWENFKLNIAKYFRGDETKVLKWGLDLQGGKTVRLELRDENNQIVTQPEALQQAVGELYTRINRLGVSEQTTRIENSTIVLEFPGSQGMTAEDLIQASAMYLHVVNEKFSVNPGQSLGDQALQAATDRFLRSVWNEAVVTNRTDEYSVAEIAWRHLGGESNAGTEAGSFAPRTDDAKLLVDNGLRLAPPQGLAAGSHFDETYSKVIIRRGNDVTEWRHSHPLMIAFYNFALEGSSLTNVNAAYEPSEGHYLVFSVKSSYSQKDGDPRADFYAWTSQFSGEAISGTAKQIQGRSTGWRLAVVLNGRVVSDPTLNASLRDGGRISGGFSQSEVNRLAADLKAGSLTFTPRVLSETNISPDLGKDERTRGIASALIGFVFVVFTMVTCYRFAGVIASVAVFFNLLVLWGVLQNLGAALTLPGIAGVILTVGMAVDANVLVYERIREEFKISGRLASSIAAGYRKAFSAIFDSNLTTVLAAVILIQFDAGPVKGFAITLAIGIISSMFTALFMTRYFFSGWVQRTKATSLEMREIFKPSNVDFLKYARPVLIASVCLAIVGGFLTYYQRQTLIGMEFTGGYSLHLELEEKSDTNYRAATTQALLAGGAYVSDFQIKPLNKPNQLEVQFGQGMEEEGRPFANMPHEIKEGTFGYTYEHNPRIVWTVSSLKAAGLDVKPGQLERLDQQWSTMSGQFSSVMRNNALFALGAAMIGILLYLTVRFEWKYGLAAIIGLVHDLVVTIGMLSVFHYFGMPVQIDMEALGALIAIIGYSLNDTIIIFDRIREDVRIHRKLTFPQVVNHAINATLSRTIMTAGTTVLVLIPLVVLGGSAILGFALIMTIGVAFGTLSSIFIASPLMLYFHGLQESRQSGNRVALNGA